MISDPNSPKTTPSVPEPGLSEAEVLDRAAALLDRVQALSRRDAGAILGLLQLVRLLAGDLLATATDDESTLVRARQSFDFSERLLRLLGDARPRH